MKLGEPIDLLLVEDNPGDVRLVREALEEVDRELRLHVVADGLQALAHLRREGVFAGVPLPRLILLDLNLPGLSGLQTLSEIKQNEQWRAIPVVVMTSSEAPHDIARAYQAQANCFVTKADDFETCVCLLRSLLHFWTGIARLP